MSDGKKRILLVEDTDSIALYLKVRLCSEGYNVDVAADGKTAFKMFMEVQKSSLPYGLIMTDMCLPDMMGSSFLDSLGQPDKRLPTIVFSADGSEENQANAFAAGADHFFEKPLNMDVFIQAVHDSLKGGDIPEQKNSAFFEEEKCKLQMLYRRHLQSIRTELKEPMPLVRLSSLLHQIKGSATLYGMTELAKIASEGGKKLKNEGDYAASTVVSSLKDALQREAYSELS